MVNLNLCFICIFYFRFKFYVRSVYTRIMNHMFARVLLIDIFLTWVPIFLFTTLYDHFIVQIVNYSISEV